MIPRTTKQQRKLAVASKKYTESTIAWRNNKQALQHKWDNSRLLVQQSNARTLSNSAGAQQIAKKQKEPSMQIQNRFSTEAHVAY